MVEIIPKPPEKEAIWFNMLFYFSIGLLISATLVYFLLGYLQGKINQSIEEVETALRVPRSAEEREAERIVLQEQKKINDFTFIFNSHKMNSAFFPFLEGIIHPKVVLSNLMLSESSVKLSGKADSFVVLGQQFLIFQKNPKIFSTNLSDNISLDEDGGVSFSFDLIISPEIFKFK